MTARELLQELQKLDEEELDMPAYVVYMSCEHGITREHCVSLEAATSLDRESYVRILCNSATMWGTPRP